MIEESRKGLTFIEILISLTILVILFAVGVFINLGFYRQSVLQADRDTLVVLFKKARSQAMGNVNQSDHGVFVGTSTYVLFQGSSYATRDLNFDEVYAKTPSVTVNGPQEVVFNAIDGLSNVSGTIVLSNEGSRETSIYISGEGRIDW